MNSEKAAAGVFSADGNVLPLHEAKISALDRGFLFADSFFETMVAFNNKILDLDQHLKRLQDSAEMLAINLPWSDDELRFELESLAGLVNVPKKVLRLIVSRGAGFGLKSPADLKPNKYVFCFPAPPEDPAIYENGIGLKRKIYPYTRKGSYAKISNYLPAVLALQTVSPNQGFHDILWTNSENELTECTTSNIFFLGRTGDLVEVATPHTDCGILEGITRRNMIDLLNKSKIPVTERSIYIDEIPRFDEAFVCSTVRGLVPVSQIDNHKLHTARKTSIFRNFERLYLTWVQTQLGYRVNWQTGSKD